MGHSPAFESCSSKVSGKALFIFENSLWAVGPGSFSEFHFSVPFNQKILQGTLQK